MPRDGTADERLQAAAIHWMDISVDAASKAAANGHLVIAGMSSDELGEPHGHVAVVLPGRLQGFPRAASANEGDGPWGKSRGEAPLTHTYLPRLFGSTEQGSFLRKAHRCFWGSVAFFPYPQLGVRITEINSSESRTSHSDHLPFFCGNWPHDFPLRFFARLMVG
jgi:hypothetical protein